MCLWKKFEEKIHFLSSRRKLRLITSLFRLGLLAKYEWPFLLFFVGNVSFEYFLSNCNQITTHDLFSSSFLKKIVEDF